MAAATGGRFRELLRKYGKVALGIHLSVSAASITGLYVAIKNNLDVESLLEKFHMGAVSPEDDKQMIPPSSTPGESDGSFVIEERLASENQRAIVVEQKKNRTAELVASTGGALTLAILCNKALFPIRVPITIALTPPVARFLARRKIYKTGV